MTKIDELIELIRCQEYQEGNMIDDRAFDRLADMLRAAVQQRDEWISGYDGPNEPFVLRDIKAENAELEKIAKGEI